MESSPVVRKGEGMLLGSMFARPGTLSRHLTCPFVNVLQLRIKVMFANGDTILAALRFLDSPVEYKAMSHASSLYDRAYRREDCRNVCSLVIKLILVNVFDINLTQGEFING